MSNNNKTLFGISKGIICQQCNCKGAYGAGLSGAISKEFPEVKSSYCELHNTFAKRNNEKGLFGRYQIIPVVDDEELDPNCDNMLAVANIFSQYDYGNSEKTGKKYTDTEKLVNSIRKIAEFYPNLPVYIPHSVAKDGTHNGIGCGLAGEKWENLFPLLKKLNLSNLYLLDTYTGEAKKVMPAFQINPLIKTPIYKQIAAYYRKEIFKGTFKHGDYIPSIRQLALDLEISTISVLKAYTELSDEGLICSVKGKGYIVVEPSNKEIRKKGLKDIEELSMLIYNKAYEHYISTDEVIEIITKTLHNNQGKTK